MPELVKVNLDSLKRFRDAVDADLRGSGQGPIRMALRQWAARFRSFLRERFDQMSKGGGWAPLKPGTIRARRAKGGGTRGAQVAKLQKQQKKLLGQMAKARDAGNQEKATAVARKLSANREKSSGLVSGAGISILRDTGILFAALSPQFSSKPGQLQEDIPFGVRVGYGGPGAHLRGKATVADIARFHQTGAGPLPARTIVDRPDQATMRLMAGDMQRAIDKLVRDTGNGR